ncbi:MULTISPECIES: hypothetical protein [unclassified Devosia]|uniref:hypothetical protein n=1 Tax=unclassified Devosia TaxID=196773 RepID=UPI00086B59FF|nr:MULTISPECIES: hypothetical protein [unclassified Devosia]MBN9365380.1 hypothetical protein [Devosia sp.]ODS85112.1 MAG: hypothetical protein ABS47_17740 [Devosia sp. SCN 66-27]OJX20330.1 MAG: hypothetical protein BGO83_04890 [Devosia sp. 66-14]
MTDLITVETLIQSMADIQLDQAPAELAPMIARGRAALEQHLALFASDQEAALRADVETVRSYFDLESVDDYLEQLVDFMVSELRLLTSSELATITEETGGRIVANTRRTLAAEILKGRLA